MTDTGMARSIITCYHHPEQLPTAKDSIKYSLLLSLHFLLRIDSDRIDCSLLLLLVHTFRSRKQFHGCITNQICNHTSPYFLLRIDSNRIDCMVVDVVMAKGAQVLRCLLLVHTFRSRKKFQGDILQNKLLIRIYDFDISPHLCITNQICNEVLL
jgi:hypothetical protein